jgi:D-aminopeptidase
MTKSLQSMGAIPVSVEFDEKAIDGIFSGFDRCDLPGAAVGIAINGKPFYRKGFGCANWDSPLTLTPATRMRIYSITKHFTCLAYLLLCEDGKAKIDDRLGKYFPEFHPVIRQVTIRQLMGNIGGLRDAYGLSVLFGGAHRVPPSAELITLYRTIDDVDAQPGTTWIYNNGGFLLIGRAAEQISGMHLAEFLQRRIFGPLGMNNTSLRCKDADLGPGTAATHMAVGDSFVKPCINGEYGGADGVVSTIDDVLRWLAQMDAPSVGSEQTWTHMKTPQSLLNGTSTGYGLGLFNDSYRGVDLLHHPGFGIGASAQILKVPAIGLDVVVISNRSDVSSPDLSLRILDALVPGFGSFERSFEGSLIRGTFRSEATGRVIRLFARNDRQMAEMGGAVDSPLAGGESGVLRPAQAAIFPYRYSISLIGEQNNPSALRLKDYGTSDELFRVPAVLNPDQSAISGRYRSEGTGTDVTIREGNMLTVGRFGRMRYGLECVAQNIWRATSLSELTPFLGGLLSFDKAGFYFWSYCARALPFRRVV